ncbi:hypothetical protein Leryth_013907 [Lithospermum erythrorhizon]|nr:hypothetical protein Leryth_013907 [Lithospermum erythrorhizon]
MGMLNLFVIVLEQCCFNAIFLRYREEGQESIENKVQFVVNVLDVAEALILAYDKPEAEGRYDIFFIISFTVRRNCRNLLQAARALGLNILLLMFKRESSPSSSSTSTPTEPSYWIRSRKFIVTETFSLHFLSSIGHLLPCTFVHHSYPQSHFSSSDLKILIIAMVL